MNIHTYQIITQDYYARRFVAAFTRHSSFEHIRTWCIETFGPASTTGSDPEKMIWQDNIRLGEVVFAHEADLALFLMKWNSYNE